MRNIIKDAKIFASKKHQGQVRKYTNDPYVAHCENVASSVAMFSNNPNVICAALLHDTIEDTNTTHDELKSYFNTEIADMVLELTDVYTKFNYENLNRKERKFLEACRLKTISQNSKLIKYFDIMDNSSSIFKFDANFSKVYLKEKQFIISYSLSDLAF